MVAAAGVGWVYKLGTLSEMLGQYMEIRRRAVLVSEFDQVELLFGFGELLGERGGRTVLGGEFGFTHCKGDLQLAQSGLKTLVLRNEVLNVGRKRRRV